MTLPGKFKFFLLLFCLTVIGVDFHLIQTVEDSGIITIETDGDDYAQQIDTVIPQSFLLEKIGFTTDVAFQEQEFLYLVNLCEGCVVTSVDIKKAVSALIKKKKFKTIVVQVKEGKKGKLLHFDLQSLWTFQNVTVKGVWFGKERLRGHYLLEPGEEFDEKKHALSLEKVRDLLKTEGYVGSKVKTVIKRDPITKTVSVVITIGRGDRFSIGSVVLRVSKKNKRAFVDDEFSVVQEKNAQKFLQGLVNKPYDKQVINKQSRLLKAFLSQEGFLNSTIKLQESFFHDQKHVDLVFNIDLNKKKEFIFLGNNFFSGAQLRDRLLLFGYSAWLLPGSLLLEEILRMYNEKGFWQVKIEFKEENERYFFLINEGKRAKITKINLENVTHCESLKRAQRFFRRDIKNRFHDRDILKKVLDKLLHFYGSEGYFEAHVVKEDFVIVSDRENYQLVVTIDEGERSYIQGVTIKGFDNLLKKGPFQVFTKIKEPIPFKSSLINQQRKWLINYFKKQGKPRPEIKLETERDGSFVTLNWKVVDSRESILFGKTILLGSTVVPFSCFSRELCYREGEPWDQDKIRQSLLRLKKMESFDYINLSPCPVIENGNERAVLLKVCKDDPFELRMRGGLGLQQVARKFSFDGITYKVGGTFLVKNPLNRGDLLSVDSDFTRGFRRLAVQYWLPGIGSLPIHSTFKAYNHKYQQPGFIGCPKNLYDVTQQGFLISEHYVRTVVDGGVNCGVEWMEIGINHDDPHFEVYERRIAQALNFESDLMDKKIPYFLLEPTLFIDLLDNKLDPSQGTLTTVSMKAMIPLIHKYLKSYSVKLMFEQSLFVPLGRMVGAFRIRLGYIFHKSFKSIMPTERFYLGGANSMRGYEMDMAPPLGCFMDEKNRACYVPQGGKSILNSNIELRFPLFRSIGGVVFQDIGMLSSGGFADFKLRGLLGSTGWGIRYNTLLGPLRFDIGWKWFHDSPIDTAYSWFLSFGHAF